jgi:hypothetical protein
VVSTRFAPIALFRTKVILELYPDFFGIAASNMLR